MATRPRKKLELANRDGAFSANNDFKDAYVIEATDVSRLVDAINGYAKPSTAQINATFENGHSVDYASVDEMMDDALTKARGLKTLHLHAYNLENRRSITVRITNYNFIAVGSYDIKGDKDGALAIEHNILTIMQSCERALSFFNRFDLFISLIFSIIILAIVGWRFPQLDILGIILITGTIPLLYNAISYCFFPRLEFDFGRGARRYALRAQIRNWVLSTLILGYLLYVLFEYFRPDFLNAS